MGRFIECVCDDNLRALIIDGDATDIELRDAFNLIISEYYKLKGETSEIGREWQLVKEIRRSNYHLFSLHVCISALRIRYSKIIADYLCSIGYRFRPISQHPEDYEELLTKIIQQSKTTYIRLQQQQGQLDELLSKRSEKYTKPTRADYERVLSEIEEMQGTVYDIDKMTVSKYVVLENKYWRKIEYLKNKNEKAA